MASEHKNGLVGVCFCNDTIKLVEVEFSGGQYQINRIIQKNVNLPDNFYSGLKLNDSSVAQISQIINDVVKSVNLKITDTVLTLNSQTVLFKKVPVDADLPEQELRNQIYWEAEQYVTQPIKDYIIDFNRLVSESEQSFNDLLLVMVRKALVNFWLGVFKNTKLNLKIIDVDLLTAIRSIKSNYEYQDGEKIGLIDVGRQMVKLTLMINGDYYHSSEFNLRSSQNGNAIDSPHDDEELSKLISKELRRLILDHKIGKYVDDLDRIFLYGEDVTEGLVEGLQNAYNVRINKVNPFRKVRFISSDVGGDLVRNSPETFVVCVGAALRKN